MKFNLTTFVGGAKTKIAPTFNKAFLKAKHYSPEICIGVGIVTAGFAIFEACKATLAADKVLTEHHDNMDHLNDLENEDSEQAVTHDDIVADKTKVYFHTAVELTKLYLPAALLFALSTSSFLASSGILKKRNAALTAAYTAVDEAFSKYRKRAIEKFGEEVDKELRFGSTVKKEITVTEQDENGNDVERKKFVDVAEETPTGYSYLFDEVSGRWHRDINLTTVTLSGIESLMQQRLEASGYLFLNTVLKELDLPLTEEGQIVGWVWKADDPNLRDNVRFGKDWEIYRREGDPSTYLDMNCHRIVASIFTKTDTDRRYKTEKRRRLNGRV